MKRVAFTLVELIVVLAIIGVLIAVSLDGPFISQFLYYFLFGWIFGLWRLVAGLANEPAAVGFGILVFLLLPIAFHIFVAQIAKRRNKQWTFKKSFVVSSLIILIAGAGIATVGGIHEIIWLSGDDEPFIENRGSSAVTAARRVVSHHNLKQHALSIHNYIDMNDQHLPFGGTILDNGKLGHGWITQILPYCDQEKLYNKIDFSKSWDDPVNAPIFRERLKNDFESHFVKVLPKAERIDRNGFAHTDYAANQFVLPVGKSLRVEEITDGMSNTILAGEVVQNLQAWGSPLNSRNPKLGINKSPYGFGSKHINGMNFVFGNGSVRLIHENIDQKILDALATPNGGEPEEVP